MARLLRIKPGCVVAISAAVLLAGGCAQAHGRAAGAAQRTSPVSHPRPPVTGDVKRAGFLTAVACQPGGGCMAVGWYYGSSAGPGRTLAARWNGRTWQGEPTASAGHGSRLDGLSCASASACLAVGVPAQAWTGTRWAAIPPGPDSSVSCPVPGWCQAVGPLPGGSHLAAARWNGRTWLAEPLPAPAPAPQTLTLASISCTSAWFCMAVGDASHGASAQPSPGYRDQTLAEEWDGSRWQIIPTPSPPPHSQLRGISCTTPTACTAVGSTASGQQTLAERWNGTRWAIQPTPNLSHIGYTALTAVSCATATACTAVGTYDGGAAGIAEQWNGAHWTIQRLPTPPPPPGGQPLLLPASISCTPAACMTVGTTQNMPLAEQWNGSRWIIAPIPIPNPT